MMKFNLSDSFSAIYMDIKRLLHTQSVHNTNVKVLNSSFKNEKKKYLALLAAIQPCYAIWNQHRSLLRGIVPVGCRRDQLCEPGLWRPVQAVQLEARRNTPYFTELQPDSPSIFKGNPVDMQCPLVELISSFFPSGFKYSSSDFSCFNSLQKKSFLSWSLSCSGLFLDFSLAFCGCWVWKWSWVWRLSSVSLSQT